MSEPVDQEVEAIKAVLTALAPLSEKARASVLDYVVRRLSVPSLTPRLPAPPAPAGIADVDSGGAGRGASPVHIKQFKEESGPRSANEMAAVVAYYLANVAAPAERKASVNHKDIESYFKIAGFRLPRRVRQTLPNAKNAGYFDLVGEGEYRLNAVGHNLVAHSLPRGQLARRGKGRVREGGARTRKAVGRRSRPK